jgi:hypothetical protein
MPPQTPPSFSPYRKWSLGLNLLVSTFAVLALVLMINYLAARHYVRLPVSARGQTPLSPLTERVLAGTTNEVRVTIYFDKHGPLYEPVWSLLKEYHFRNPRIAVEVVDCERDPGAASLIKAKYKLSDSKDRDLVIFDCRGRTKYVYENELSELDIQSLIAGRSKEVRRTHFKGELLFTSAIFGVNSSRSLKAYFLQGHEEHSPESEDGVVGYSAFAGLLKNNNIERAMLSLVGTNEVPADCHLLIIASPQKALSSPELAKIDQYLKNGGRLFALFSYLSVEKATGLERILLDWGVEVGFNVVTDLPNSNLRDGGDIVSSTIGSHAIVKPLQTPLDLIRPRSVRKKPGTLANADAPNVNELVFTGPEGMVHTDIRNGLVYARPATDLRTNVCLAVAVEKGRIRGVTTERGTTRIVVVGDSLFLGNQMIEKLGNRDFAWLALNWLLDRSELLAIPPRPITEYKLVMTQAETSAVRWILLAGMPGAVLLVGLLVAVRRRK